MELYRLEVGTYPSTEEGLNALYENPGSVTGWKQYSTKPITPDPWGHPYIYTFPGSSGENSYTLMSYGADGVAGGEDYNADIIEAF